MDGPKQVLRCAQDDNSQLPPYPRYPFRLSPARPAMKNRRDYSPYTFLAFSPRICFRSASLTRNAASDSFIFGIDPIWCG